MVAAEFDPFRVIVGLVEESDTLVRIANAAGLRFDLTLTEREAGAHKTRVRALLPRIVAAYESLNDAARLVAARAAAAELSSVAATWRDRVFEALARVGWELRDQELVVVAPEVREMFFPRGSQWDAYVVLRDVLAEAKADLVIVDAYCDGSIFAMLAGRDLAKLAVRILCSQYAKAVAAEAKAFVAQHPGVSVEVRQTKDFHDRFIVVDGVACVHVGASIKDAGKTAFMVSRVEDEENRDVLLASIMKSWGAATIV